MGAPAPIIAEAHRAKSEFRNAQTGISERFVFHDRRLLSSVAEIGDATSEELGLNSAIFASPGFEAVKARQDNYFSNTPILDVPGPDSLAVFDLMDVILQFFDKKSLSRSDIRVLSQRSGA